MGAPGSGQHGPAQGLGRAGWAQPGQGLGAQAWLPCLLYPPLPPAPATPPLGSPSRIILEPSQTLGVPSRPTSPPCTVCILGSPLPVLETPHFLQRQGWGQQCFWRLLGARWGARVFRGPWQAPGPWPLPGSWALAPAALPQGPPSPRQQGRGPPNAGTVGGVALPLPRPWLLASSLPVSALPPWLPWGVIPLCTGSDHTARSRSQARGLPLGCTPGPLVAPVPVTSSCPA